MKLRPTVSLRCEETTRGNGMDARELISRMIEQAPIKYEQANPAIGSAIKAWTSAQISSAVVRPDRSLTVTVYNQDDVDKVQAAFDDDEMIVTRVNDHAILLHMVSPLRDPAVPTG